MINLPETNNKVAILFTGGVESYLLGKLCVQQYGADNVVFVAWNMDEYNVFYKNDDKRNRVKEDFLKSVKNVGGHITMIIDNNKYQSETGNMANRTVQIIKNSYPDVKYVLGGYNNVHKESFEIFQLLDIVNNRDNATQRGRLEVFSNKKKYPELIEFLTECNGMIYFVEEDFTLKSPDDLASFYNCEGMVAPFYDLTKTEVVKLYAELGLLEDLYKSNSCNVDGHTKHCGVCRNCLARRVAIRNAGVEDKTEYLC